MIMDRRTLLASLTGSAALLMADGRFAWAQSEGRPGPRNLITDVAGLTVGQADDPKVRTGVTVILPEGRATCAADVRGGGPGTRETDALNSWNLVHSVDAVVLSGGSVYGLAAADGVACVVTCDDHLRARFARRRAFHARNRHQHDGVAVCEKVLQIV